MPSSFTPRLRLEMQAAGENLNTWGTLTTGDLSDYAADQASRSAAQKAFAVAAALTL